MQHKPFLFIHLLNYKYIFICITKYLWKNLKYGVFFSTGCTAAFEAYVPFKEHLSICDNARNRSSPKCPHCNKTFQKNAAFLTHVGLHGIPRYICSLCDSRFTTPKKAEDHIKQNHKVNSFKVIPANPLKDNSHEDLYIVLPNSVSKIFLFASSFFLKRVLTVQYMTYTYTYVTIFWKKF